MTPKHDSVVIFVWNPEKIVTAMLVPIFPTYISKIWVVSD